MSTKYFAIFIWINDEPKTGNVLNLSNIVEPRKPIGEYKEQERVKAKCPGFGLQDAVIAKISDEAGKKELGEILAGSSFKELVKNLNVTNTASDGEEKVQEGQKDPETEKNKKRKHPEKIETANSKTDTSKKRKEETGTEASEAKKNQMKDKTQKDKARSNTNIQVSGQIMSSASTELHKKMDKLLSKVSSLVEAMQRMEQQQQVLSSGQDQLSQKLDNVLAIAQCSKCLRAQYKLTQQTQREIPAAENNTCTPNHPSKGKGASRTLTDFFGASDPATANPKAKAATVTPKAATTVTPKGVTAMPQADINSKPGTSSNVVETVSIDDVQIDVIDDDATNSSGIQNKDCSSGFSYFGETKYGIKVNTEELQRVRLCSKTRVKFALNAIELLVTPHDCKDKMTVYGEGKGTRPLDENKRRALRSEIFSSFPVSNEEERTKLWMDTLVPKLNNKIRGIRNDKYKLSKD